MVSGARVTSTRIVSKGPYPFYFLTFKGFTVRKLKLNYFDIPSTVSSIEFGEGNIIIESGTTLTFLPPVLYSKFVSAVRSQIKAKPTKDPMELLDLCYSVYQKKNFEIPEIIAHFSGGDVKLHAKNTFARTTNTSMCAEASSMAIYGNLARMDFLIGYDLEKKTVSFKPTDCTKSYG